MLQGSGAISLHSYFQNSIWTTSENMHDKDNHGAAEYQQAFAKLIETYSRTFLYPINMCINMVVEPP